MRVLVCGGRNYSDKMALFAAMSLYDNREGPFTLLIHGGATGADTLVNEWAKQNHIPMQIFIADWEKYGRAAGPIRNDRMLIDGEPDLVIAFPGGYGTADMVKRSEAAGVNIIRVSR